MPVTMLELAQASREPLQAGILLNLLRYTDLMQHIPVSNVDTMTVQATRWNTLPTPSWRRVSGGYTEGTGTLEQVSEGLFILGHDVEIDRIYGVVTGGMLEDPRTTQINMALKALGFEFNDAFVNGDHAVDPDRPIGLKARCEALPSRQKIRPGTGTDAYDCTADEAHRHGFLDAAHELVDIVSPCSVLVCNRGLRRGLSRVLRRSGLLDTAKDQFDRKTYMFDGVPIIDIGLKADKSTEIITNTEDPGDGGNDTTSMYALRFAEPDEEVDSPGSDGFQIIQAATLEPYDPLNGGEKESGPQQLVRFDWPVGFANMGDDYNIARMWGVEDPASWT